MYANHFSIIDVSLDQQIRELQDLGFKINASYSPKKLLQRFLLTAPIDLTVLQATKTLDVWDFLTASEIELDADIFYTIAWQLLGFHLHFDYQVGEACHFAEAHNLPVLKDQTFDSEGTIQALYLLLNTRTNHGMTLVDDWVSRDLLKVDNTFHFFNGKSLATFDTRDLIKELVYVDTGLDTDNDGLSDLVVVQIIRPKTTNPLPVVLTASPYHLGTNRIANDLALHDMNTVLTEKTPQTLQVTTHPLPIRQDKHTHLPTSKTRPTRTFTHGWTSSLNDYLLARGFASVYVAGLGTRGSDGLMTSGDYQQVMGMTAVIEWLNGDRLAFTDRSRTQTITAEWTTGKVAMTGKSYLATMSYGAATTGVKGLEVILAEAGISSWYDYYRENGSVRSPGGYPGEDLDVLTELTYSKNMDASDYLKHNKAYQAHLQTMTDKIDRNSGDYSQYWHDRNYLPYAHQVTADVLVVHGLQDWNVTPRQAFQFWQALPQSTTKHAFLHQGDHIYINNWQSLDFSEIINAYFVHKLLDKPLTLKLPPIIWQENSQYQRFKSLPEWGSQSYTSLPVPSIAHNLFDQAYSQTDFDRYSKDFRLFHNELDQGNAKGLMLDFVLSEDCLINGTIKLDTRVKVSDTKGILSARILDYTPKKQLNALPSALDLKVIDRGHNFQFDDLKELTLTDKRSHLVTRAQLNLQNRTDLLTIDTLPQNQYVEVTLTFEPTIYQFNAGDTLRLVLYSTDFELSIHDNTPKTYTFDLDATELHLPHH